MFIHFGEEDVEVPMIVDLGEIFIHVRHERSNLEMYVLSHKRTGCYIKSHARLEPLLDLADRLKDVDMTSSEPGDYAFHASKTIAQKWFEDLIHERDVIVPEAQPTVWEQFCGFFTGLRFGA